MTKHYRIAAHAPLPDTGACGDSPVGEAGIEACKGVVELRRRCDKIAVVAPEAAASHGGSWPDASGGGSGEGVVEPG